MISNALVIHSGGRPASSRLTESRVRSAQRRLNIAPMPLTFDDNSNSSPSKDENSHEEISLYSGNSPQGSPRPCLSPCLELGLLSPSRETESIEERHDIDYNSVDSGFSHSSRKLFAFGPGENVQSPPKTPSPTAAQKRISPKSISCFRTFNSISSDSMESMDDECIGLVDMDSLEENTSLPTSFNTIISGNIKTTSNRTPLFRRCLSLTDNNINRSKNISETKTHQVLKTIRDVSTPFAPKISIEPSRTFKRPEPPGTCSPVQIKRYKQGSITPVSSSGDKENKTSNDLPIARPILRKSISMNDAIMNALARCKYHQKKKIIQLSNLNKNIYIISFFSFFTIASSDPDLIGDFSKPFSLPLIDGRHKDLRSITVHTMAALLRGEFQDSIASFRVIDCRYPYEFEGGHIRGAENLFTHEQIINELVNTKTEDPKVIPEGPMRNIVVFHCEFSSERGPKL